MKKRIIITIACLAAVIAAAATIWYFAARETQEEEKTAEIMHSTDAVGYAEDEYPSADPLMVGKWESVEKPGWYKVYYDDFDEEMRMFWGKEWDESDDVHEEDLRYHGNGWFRWTKEDKELREYATMDVRDVPIHHMYKIQYLSPDSMVYFEPDRKNDLYRFRKQNN